MATDCACQRCGTRLDAFAPEGMCPRCMLRLAIESPGHPEGAAETSSPNLVPVGLTTPSPSAPIRFGDYELLDELGHGGMGLVYKARHLYLNRIVALKLLLPGPYSSPEMLGRFRREVQAIAALSHPGIVPVYEVGELDGQSFFTMEYVEGRILAAIVPELGAWSSDFRRMAGWIEGIAEAVEHAHAHGIVHRDLKPANILIDGQDRVHVADFGLARRLDEVSDLTLSGQVLGSPDYLAPEQASGNRGTPQPASDIYALGAMLYELLTGRPPFRSSSIQDTLLRIRDTEPVAPRLLNGSAPRDLEVICLKCLEKDPARRYATARELAEELRRWLNGEPIHARPIGTVGKTWRWCRRKPVVAGLVAAVAALLLTVTAVSMTAAWRIATARKGEQRATYYDHIALASKLIEEGSIDRALESLWKCPEQYRHWEWGHLLYLCHQDAASFQAHATNVVATSFSPDSRWVLSQDSAGKAAVWDWEAERAVFEFGSNSNRAGWISFDPQGEHLAAAMGTNGVSVWATTNWQEIVSLRPRCSKVLTLAYSPDGQRLVTGGSDGSVTVWDIASGHGLKEWATSDKPLRRVAISPDGQRLVAVADRAAWVWELQSGQLVRTFPGDSLHSTNALAVVFADDTGEDFATIDPEGRLSLWREGRAPQHLITIRGSQPWAVRQVSFSPDGRWMVNAGDENTARVWEVATGTERLAISQRVLQVVFSRDGNRMVTHGAENWVTTWDLAQGRELKVLRGHLSVVNAIGLSLDGRLAVSAEERGTVKVWSAGPGRELVQDRAWEWAITFSPNRRLIANCPWHEGVIIRSVSSGWELLRIHPSNESFLAVAFSPDSRRLVTVGNHKTAKVWDVETGELVLRLRGHHRQQWAVAYSQDGRLIATGSWDGTVRVWDAHTGQELQTLCMSRGNGPALAGVTPFVGWVEFDETTDRLLTCSSDGKVRIWNPVTGHLLATFTAIEANVGVIARFLPDSRHLITSAGNRIRIWDTASGRVVAESTGRGDDRALEVSRDGRRMLTASGEGESFVVGSGRGALEVWDIEGKPRRVFDQVGREQWLWLEFSPDDRTVASASLDSRVHRWESFPWREAEYDWDHGWKSEVRSQEGLGVRVRAYARHYWRDRLQAELNGVEGEPAEPRVIEVPIDRSLFEKRDRGATANQIDLTEFYTGELGETFHGKVGRVDEHDDDLSELPIGLVKLGGVEFDVRGVIQLRRAEPAGGPWELAASDDPVRVEAIPIAQRATRLHLLLGTIRPEADGTVIGNLVLHYADGDTRTMELVYGRDVWEWWFDPAKAETETTDRARVIWTGTNPVASRYDRRLRLYLNTRENPRPEAKITAFDLVSTMSQSAPFLIAVTAE